MTGGCFKNHNAPSYECFIYFFERSEALCFFEMTVYIFFSFFLMITIGYHMKKKIKNSNESLHMLKSLTMSVIGPTL